MRQREPGDGPGAGDLHRLRRGEQRPDQALAVEAGEAVPTGGRVVIGDDVCVLAEAEEAAGEEGPVVRRLPVGELGAEAAAGGASAQ